MGSESAGFNSESPESRFSNNCEEHLLMSEYDGSQNQEYWDDYQYTDQEWDDYYAGRYQRASNEGRSQEAVPPSSFYETIDGRSTINMISGCNAQSHPWVGSTHEGIHGSDPA